MFDRLERILYVVARDGVHDVLRKFVRACRGNDDHRRGVLFMLGDVIACRIHRAGGVRIHRVLIFLEKLVDGLHRFVFAAEIGPEQFLHLLPLFIVQFVHAFGSELVHAQLHALRLPARKLEEQPLEVGRDEDIHRRRHRLEKFAAPVVDARPDEIGQHIVLVGRTDELADGQPHALRVIRREDVPEIARRHGKIDRFARLDLSGGYEVEVCGKIVGDLRGEPAEIDGVRRREDIALLLQLRLALLAREDLFDRGLALVEIAAHGEHVHVAPLLRRHLQLLHLGNAVARVKDHDLYAVRILKPLERRLARVAAGRDEDEHLLLHAGDVAPLAQKVRQQRERQILEGAGRAVEKLEHIQARVYLDERRRVAVLEAGICLFAGGFQPFVIIFVEEFMQDGGGTFGIAHGKHFRKLRARHLGECFRHEKPAVGSDAPSDRLRPRHTFSPARTDKFHCVYPLYRKCARTAARKTRPAPFSRGGRICGTCLQIFCHEFGQLLFGTAAGDVDRQPVVLGEFVEHIIESRHILYILAGDAGGTVDEEIFIVVVGGDDALDETAERLFAGDHIIAGIYDPYIPLQVIHITFGVGNEDEMPFGGGDLAVRLVDHDLRFTGAFGAVDNFDHSNLRQKFYCTSILHFFRVSFNSFLKKFQKIFSHGARGRAKRSFQPAESDELAVFVAVDEPDHVVQFVVAHDAVAPLRILFVDELLHLLHERILLVDAMAFGQEVVVVDPIGDAREAARVVDGNARRTVEHLRRVEDVINFRIFEHAVGMDARTGGVERAPDKGRHGRNDISEFVFKVTGYVRDRREIHAVVGAAQGGVFDRHRLERAVARALADAEQRTVDGTCTVQPRRRRVGHHFVEVVVAVPLEQGARNFRMMVQPVNDALHAARKAGAGIIDAEAHRVAHTDLDGNAALAGKLHQFVCEGHDEAVKIGSRDVLEVAAGPDAERERALYDAEILVHRLRAGEVHLFEDVIIGTADEDARFGDARRLHELEILFVGADPRRDLGIPQPQRAALFERLAVFVAVQEKFALPHDPLFAAQAGHQPVQVDDLLYGERRGGLLPVAEGGVRDPYLRRHIHRDVTVVEHDLRDLVIGIEVAEQLGLGDVLQFVVILILFEEVPALVEIDQIRKPPLRILRYGRAPRRCPPSRWRRKGARTRRRRMRCPARRRPPFRAAYPPRRGNR